MRIISVYRPELNPVNVLSVIYERVSVEWLLRNQDCYLPRILFSVRKFIVCSGITFSMIFETVGSSDIGLKFWGSVIVPFLQRFQLCYFAVFWKVCSLMDINLNLLRFIPNIYIIMKLTDSIPNFICHWNFLTKSFARFEY